VEGFGAHPQHEARSRAPIAHKGGRETPLPARHGGARTALAIGLSALLPHLACAAEATGPLAPSTFEAYVSALLSLDRHEIAALTLTLGTVGPVIYFFSKGGFLPPRYIMPAAWAEFGLAAVALSWPKKPWLTQATVMILAIVSFMTFETYANKIFDTVLYAGGMDPDLKPDDFGIVTGLRSQGFPFPEYWFVLSLIALVTGVMLVMRAVAETYRPAGFREGSDLSLPGGSAYQPGGTADNVSV
jgi:hypothetical protein